MKTNIAIILASKDFRDEEYFITKEVLEKQGNKIKSVSNEKRAIGRFGGEVLTDILIEELDIDNFDAVVFVGGSGAIELLDNNISHNICRKCVEKNKILAAICISPVILAKSGVLRGKKATVWSSNMDKSAISIIKENGAIYSSDPVVIDGNIVTANGPDASEEFALCIDKILKTSNI
jgi:protease I